MRKLNAYVIYDTVSEVYSEWMFKAINENDAKRAFQRFVSQDEARPQDVILFEIGVYDRVDGLIKGYDIPKLVISGIDMVKEKEVDNGEI